MVSRYHCGSSPWVKNGSLGFTDTTAGTSADWEEKGPLEQPKLSRAAIADRVTRHSVRKGAVLTLGVYTLVMYTLEKRTSTTATESRRAVPRVPQFSSMVISTRRLRRRPASVLLSATGRRAPYPRTMTFSRRRAPRSIRYSATDAARCSLRT